METVSQGPGSRAGWAGTETSEAAGAVLVLVTLPGTMRGHLALLTRGGGREGATGITIISQHQNILLYTYSSCFNVAYIPSSILQFNRISCQFF